MRTINDIVPPSRRRGTEFSSNETSQQESVTPSRERSSKFPYKTFISMILVVALSLGVLYYFSSAKVLVTPNTVSAAVDSTFTANQSTGDLPYEIITSEKIASQSVKSSGTKTVSSFASGSITISSTQTKSQNLLAKTRFATQAGLIFRLHEAVTVPAGSAAQPSTVKVTVYADAIGDTYNVGPTSFSIPGFAGSPQATMITARSSESMLGGASGTVPVIDISLETPARTALITALSPELTSSLQDKIPSGYTLLPGAATTTFTSLASAPSPTTGMVDVKEQGVITAVVFPNSALAKAVATSVSGLGYQNEPITLLPSSSLKLSSPSLPEVNAASFSFNLAGTASLVYTIDSTRIAASVAGKSRSAAQVALTAYPEIKSAIIVLRPFWRQTFPQDPSTIAITVNKP